MTATPPRASPNPVPLLVENLSAPELFASECVGLYLQGGNIHLTFANPHANHVLPAAPAQRIVSARLIIPARCAQNLAANLYDFLKKNGLDPVPIPDKSKIQ